MTQQPKVVGQPCPKCGTPYIMGTTGVYCKPCYIKWKNGLGTQQPQTVQTPAPTRDFEKENFGKCKYGFLLEAYKKDKVLFDAEKEAEDWATASLRKNKTEELKTEELNIEDIPF